MAECDLPKVNTRVRFPSAALSVKNPHKQRTFLYRDMKMTLSLSHFTDTSGIKSDWWLFPGTISVWNRRNITNVSNTMSCTSRGITCQLLRDGASHCQASGKVKLFFGIRRDHSSTVISSLTVNGRAKNHGWEREFWWIMLREVLSLFFLLWCFPVVRNHPEHTAVTLSDDVHKHGMVPAFPQKLGIHSRLTDCIR